MFVYVCECVLVSLTHFLREGQTTGGWRAEVLKKRVSEGDFVFLHGTEI